MSTKVVHRHVGSDARYGAMIIIQPPRAGEASKVETRVINLRIEVNLVIRTYTLSVPFVVTTIKLLGVV